MADDSVSVPSPDEIRSTELPPVVTDILSEYQHRIGHRSDFLWQWLYDVFPRYRLSSVPDRHHGAVREQKLLLTIYYTLLDDLADVHGDRTTFIAARLLPFGVTPSSDEWTGVDDDYLSLAERAWTATRERLESAPRADEFWSLFTFDLQQPLTAMHYGCLVREYPQVLTETDTDVYDQHNMAQFSYADIDIMHSPAFEQSDLGGVREVVWAAQRLARISNWVATWERELAEGDPTSAVVVRALRDGVVSLSDVTDPERDADHLVERIRDHGIEQAFLDEWDRLYDHLRQSSYDIASVDAAAYVTGMVEMRDLYLAYSDRL